MAISAIMQMQFVYILVASLILLTVSNILSVFSRRHKIAFFGTIAFLFISLTATALLYASNASFYFFSIFHTNAFSEFFFMFFAIAIIMVETLSYKYSHELPAFSLLLSLVTFGVFLVTFAYSLIAILVGLETVALASTFMIIMNGKRFVEPAVKLFILSAISIAIFTFALALLLPYDPQLTLSLPGTSQAGSYLLGLSLILFAGALSLDAAAFPFNLWVPDVYEGSPSNVTALLASVNKKVSFIAILEVFIIIFAAYRSSFGTPLFSLVFFFLSIFTMFFGNLVALVQKNLKRLFAYSSISQAGYIFIGIAVASTAGIQASIFYIVSHMFMIIGAFAIVLWLESKSIRNIDECTGLASKNSFAAISLTILMLSMAGIPPLVGFIGKFLLFSSAVYANDAVLAFIGIINSFISIYYYAKVINQMYTRRQGKKMQMDKNIAIVVIVCLIFVIAVGIYPQILISAASSAASALGAV